MDSLKNVFNVLRREAIVGYPCDINYACHKCFESSNLFKKCAQVCPWRCCGLHPTLVKRIGQRLKMNDISLSGYPKICADICSLECPHRSCGLGSLKRSFIPRGTYATRSFHDQVPLSRYSIKAPWIRLKEKRHVMHQ